MTEPNPADPGSPSETDEEFTEAAMPETTPEEDAMGADAAETLAGDEDVVIDTADADIDGSGELSDAEQQLAERTADLQRVSAEYANYRKRTERDRVGIRESAKADVAAQLIRCATTSPWPSSTVTSPDRSSPWPTSWTPCSAA